jgi:SAM-dependent methyltransferase
MKQNYRDLVDISTSSKALYEDPAVAADYGSVTELQPPEVTILERIADEVRGRAVLDIGIGGGRTVGPLRAVAGRYVGFDFSDAMVAVARQLHPDADIHVGDVRDLSAFDDGSFRLAFFSFNGIDSISHDDRLSSLGEIHRVVEVDGLFVFSAHNDVYEPTLRKLWFDGLHIGRRPLPAVGRLIRSAPRIGCRVLNHLRHRHDTIRTDEYAIRCDGGRDHTVLSYYITRSNQVDQLTSAGFATEAVYDLEGREAAADCKDPWLYYLTRVVPIDPLDEPAA